MVWAYRLAAISAALLISGSAAAAQRTEDCRAIAEPARRLACYDAREANPTQQPVTSSAAQPGPFRHSSVIPMSAPAGVDPNRTFNSSIAAASLLRNGLYRIRLADGSEWTTAIIGQRPRIGEKVHHRRTMIGTHYFDTENGRPLTVRPER
jgi:hypothetical protein